MAEVALLQTDGQGVQRPRSQLTFVSDQSGFLLGSPAVTAVAALAGDDAVTGDGQGQAVGGTGGGHSVNGSRLPDGGGRGTPRFAAPSPALQGEGSGPRVQTCQECTRSRWRPCIPERLSAQWFTLA